MTDDYSAIPALIEQALSRATEKIALLSAAMQEPPTWEELADWLNRPPSQWPGTPSLSVWASLDAVDPALRFEMAEGHLRNLLDEAVNLLKELEVLRPPPVDTPPPSSAGTGA